MKHTAAASQKDFSQGSVAINILRLALPMTLAQLINVLYNMVDRIYIGHLPHTSTQALTGIGLTLPVITIITAFANLFGMGGAPLFSIARGAGETERAKRIMGNSVLRWKSATIMRLPDSCCWGSAQRGGRSWVCRKALPWRN